MRNVWLGKLSYIITDKIIIFEQWNNLFLWKIREIYQKYDNINVIFLFIDF